MSDIERLCVSELDEDPISDIESLNQFEPDEARSLDEANVSDDRDSVGPCHDDVASFTPATPNTTGVDMLNGCTARTPMYPTRFTHDEKRHHR